MIVPLEYLHAGGPPPSLFIDDLMKAMERPYYVGLLSAAALHGASHQQPQEFQVFSDRPIRPIQVGRSDCSRSCAPAGTSPTRSDLATYSNGSEVARRLRPFMNGLDVSLRG